MGRLFGGSVCCFSVYITKKNHLKKSKFPFAPLYVIKGDGSQFVKARPHVKQTFQYFLGAKRENVATCQSYHFKIWDKFNIKIIEIKTPTKKRLLKPWLLTIFKLRWKENLVWIIGYFNWNLGGPLSKALPEMKVEPPPLHVHPHIFGVSFLAAQNFRNLSVENEKFSR